MAYYTRAYNALDLIHAKDMDKPCDCQSCDRRYQHDPKKGNTVELCNTCLVNERRFAAKQKCVDYKGGKCERCGYDKSLRALSFHHKDPSKKAFAIAGSHTRSWKALKTEVDKCLLLCANCHMEEHGLLEKTLIRATIVTLNGMVEPADLYKYTVRGSTDYQWNNKDFQKKIGTGASTTRTTFGRVAHVRVTTKYITELMKAGYTVYYGWKNWNNR
jgi:hypothetical protein